MIKLQCIGHSAEYELTNIVNLFIPYVDETYRVESTYENGVAKAKLFKEEQLLIQKEHNVEQLAEEKGQKKETKKRLKATLYEVLVALTGKEMPWGVLTGIRPTKIVHEYRHQGLTEEAIREELKTTYHISEAKIDLMVEVATKEEAILEKNKINEINLYIGIPFCPTRCVYCSFTAYSLQSKGNQVDAYLEALCKEISFVAEAKRGIPIRSLYIGGGTPTSINEEQLERLLKHIKNSFDLSQIEEYTVEAGRPDTITAEKLEIMKRMDVGRISINPQTMNQKTLDAIGRKHSVEEIKEIFKIARELGHDNINMDIILGLPGEEPQDVAYTLAELEKLNPDNITVHTMAIKRASKLRETKEEYDLAGAKKIEDMLALCGQSMKKIGLEPYYMYRQKNMLGNFENVGYAKPNKECVYNIEIMEEKESIIAMGAGAITKMVYENGERIDRVPNVKSLEDYITRIDEMIERKKEGFKKYK